VTHGREVLEMVGAAGEHLVAVPRGPERPRDQLSRSDQQVLELVPVATPAGLESIAGHTALHVRDVDSALRRLERGRFVEHVDGGWRVVVAR
jgi:DNA processing protein